MANSASTIQGVIKAACRRTLGVDSSQGTRGKDLFAELFPDQPQRLAQVIPFPTRTTGGAA